MAIVRVRLVPVPGTRADGCGDGADEVVLAVFDWSGGGGGGVGSFGGKGGGIVTINYSDLIKTDLLPKILLVSQGQNGAVAVPPGVG